MSPNGNCLHFLESSVCRGTIYIRDFLIWLEMEDMSCIETNGRYQVFRYQPAASRSHLGKFLVCWLALRRHTTTDGLELSGFYLERKTKQEHQDCTAVSIVWHLASTFAADYYNLVYFESRADLWENYKTDKTPVSSNLNCKSHNSMWWLGEPHVKTVRDSQRWGWWAVPTGEPGGSQVVSKCDYAFSGVWTLISRPTIGPWRQLRAV